MWDKLYKIIDRIFVIFGALFFAQFPLFYQEYIQRLSGHIDELKYQVELMQETATHSGKTLQEFIQKFLSSTDLDFTSQGELMKAMVHRLDGLSDSLLILKHNSVLTKPFAFFLHSDTQVVKATFYHFTPGISLSLEGICYVIIGMFVGYFVFRLIEKGCLYFSNIFNKMKKSS